MKKVLGLVGLLALSSNANAQDTGYSEMSRPAITQQLKKRAVVLDQNNFQREVLDYDGAVMVLFDSTSPATANAEILNNNMDIVYLGLMDRFDSARVNRLDLKFAYFDGCNFYERPNGLFALLGVNDLETHMYLDGRKIDVMRGGPTNERGIQAFNINMPLWIEYTLLGIKQPEDQDKDVIALYKGTASLQAYPRSEIQR